MANCSDIRKNTILLVEDEDHLIFFLQKLLRAEGYNVLIAQTGQQAVELYKENLNCIDMLLLDIVLPDLTGIEVYNEIRSISPDILVLLMSGYPKESFKGIEHIHFIQKPMYPSDFFSKIKEIFEGADTARLKSVRALDVDDQLGYVSN